MAAAVPEMIGARVAVALQMGGVLIVPGTGFVRGVDLVVAGGGAGAALGVILLVIALVAAVLVGDGVRD